MKKCAVHGLAGTLASDCGNAVPDFLLAKPGEKNFNQLEERVRIFK